MNILREARAQEFRPCPTCEGLGHLDLLGKSRCNTCKGRGMILKENNNTNRQPPGVLNT